MVSEVLTYQNSLQREQGKNIVGPFYNSLSSKSHQVHIIVLTCQKLPREGGEKECMEKGWWEGNQGAFPAREREGKEDSVLKSNSQRGLLYQGQTGRRKVGDQGRRRRRKPAMGPNCLWWLLNHLPHSEPCNSLLVPSPQEYLEIPPDLFQVLTLTPLQSNNFTTYHYPLSSTSTLSIPLLCCCSLIAYYWPRDEDKITSFLLILRTVTFSFACLLLRSLEMIPWRIAWLSLPKHCSCHT